MFLRVENKSQWSALLDKAFLRTFFHYPQWEEFLEREFSWLKFERYVWRDEFLLSIARCKFMGREKLVSHPLCEYGGPLQLKEKVDLDGFIEDFKRAFGNAAKIKFHPYISYIYRTYQGENPIRSGSDPGRSTFWIENFSTKNFEDLWRGFRKTLRQEIKKSERAGLAMKECESENDLEQLYNVYVQTMKRHKNIPLPFSAFKFFFVKPGGSNPARRGLTPHAQAEIYTAKIGAKVVGGSVFLFYPPFIHYFINASDYKFRDLNIGHAILWHVMQKYVGYRKPHMQYDYFDLGGTKKGSALEVFKRGWGAKERPIYEVGCARSATGNNSLLREVWSLLPHFAMKAFVRRALWLKV